SKPIVRRTRTNCGLIVRAQRSCSSPAPSSRASRPIALMRLNLRDSRAYGELGPVELNFANVRDATDERESRPILAPGERRDLADAGRTSVRDELGRKRRADAVMLLGVGNGECNFRGGAIRTDEACDR